MPTDIIMDVPTPIPTPYTLPQGMVINPFFDTDLFIGVPVWMWIIVALGILLICVWIRWIFRWSKMRAVAGYRDKITSADQKSQQVWYLGINKTFSIYCMKFQDRILSFYEYMQNLDKWLLTSKDATGSCGGVSMMMVGNDSEYVKDPVAEIAICTIAKRFSEDNGYDEKNNPNYYEYFTDGKKQKRQKIIKSYSDFSFFLPVLEKLYPNGVDIAPYCFYNSSESQQYTPQNSSLFFGARRTKVARDLIVRTNEKPWYVQLMPLAIAVVSGTIGTLFVYMVVMA